MLDQYLNRIQSIFDRRFVLAYWFPALLFSISGFILMLAFIEVRDFLRIWGQMTTWQQGVLIMSALIIVTFIALLLEAFSSPILRFYRGYSFPNPLAEWMLVQQNRNRENRRKKYADLRKGRPNVVYQFNYDDLSKGLYPTELGNILGTETDYSFERYGIDGNIWWSRLIMLLPDYVRQRLDTTITPVLMMINLSLLSLVFAFLGSFMVALFSSLPFLFLFVYLTGLILFFVFYRAGVTAAFGYSETVKSVYDLYRLKLLEEMRIPIPKDQVEENRIWYVLNNWVKLKLPPGESLKSIEDKLKGDLAQKHIKRLNYSSFTEPGDQKEGGFEVRLFGKPFFRIEKKSSSGQSNEK